jgi:hypothetical protein
MPTITDFGAIFKNYLFRKNCEYKENHMPYYYRELDIRLTNALNLMANHANSSQSLHDAVTYAACCIYNKSTGTYVTGAGGQVLIISKSSGGGTASMGHYRRLIHNHNTLKNTGGKFRSSDAELKILDHLMTLTTWGQNNLVVIKVSRKPCKACSYAISKFFRDHSGSGALAVCWPGDRKIYGTHEGPELE